MKKNAFKFVVVSILATMICPVTPTHAASSIAAWGWNNSGQTTIPDGLTNVVAVAGGELHSLALKMDGTVVAWGALNASNADQGSLDFGQTIVPPGLSNVVAIAAGGYHNLALRNDGTVVAWGAGTNDPLSSVNSADLAFGQNVVPDGLNDAMAVAASLNSSLVLRSNGTVIAWGSNSYNQTNVPADLSNVVAIAAGDYHFLALKSDGTVVAWGGSDPNLASPPTGLNNVIAIAAGGNHNLALKKDGTVVAWGANVYGLSVPPGGLSNVIAIAAGFDFNLALRKNGIVVAWGNNQFGELNVPIGLSNALSIAAGSLHGLAIVDGIFTPLPMNLSGPTNQTVFIGATVIFSVVADGAPPVTYQWLRSGVPLTDQTNSFLVLPNVNVNQAGSYSVAVSNSLGGVISASATLTVLPVPPTIIHQPTNITTYVGSNVTFVVQASGTPSLSYQWFFNGAPIQSQISPVLSLLKVQLTNTGVYSVVITNIGGSVVSSNAVLVVKPIPNCVPVPQGLVSWWRAEKDATDAWGSNNGTPLYNLLTTSGKVGQAFGVGPERFIQVPDSPSLRFTNAFTIEAWVYPSNVTATTLRTIVSKFDFDGPSPALPPQVLGSSYYLGITNGNFLVFKVSATGSPSTNTTLKSFHAIPTNQWTHVAATFGQGIMRLFINGQEDTKISQSGGVFPGFANVGIGAIPYSGYQNGIYPFTGLIDELSVYNRELSEFDVRAIYESDIIGKCLTPPTIVVPPQDRSVPLGEDVKFTVTATGNQPLRYRWFFNGVALPAGTNASLLLEKLQTNQAGLYSVVVSNALGSATSPKAQLTILPPPTCVAPPSGLISWWPADGNAADAMGTNNGTYFNGAYATGKVDRAFNNIPFAQVQVPSSPSLNFGSNANFTIEAWIKTPPTNSVSTNTILEKRTLSPGAVNQGYALLLVQGRLAFWIATPPASNTNAVQFVSSGPDLRDDMFHHVAITANRTTTNGGTLFVDGQPVSTFDLSTRSGSLASSSPLSMGVSRSSLSFTGLIDEIAFYDHALSSTDIQAIVQAGAAGKCKVPPSIITQPVSQRVVAGSNVTLRVTATGSPLLRYQWLQAGVQAVPGATNAEYTFKVFNSVTYTVRVTNVFGSVVSSNVTVTVDHPPTALAYSYFMDEDTVGTLSLIAIDEDHDPLSFIIVTPPAHGGLTASATNGTFLYLPATNFFGSDSFKYKVNDGLIDSGTVLVTIVIKPVNDPPVAYPQAVTVNEDTPASIVLTASDVENDPLTYFVGVPAHGTLTGTPPNLTYLPATNYFGSDSFTYSVSDGQTNSQPAKISITVLPVNDPPVAEIVVAPLAHLPGITNLAVIAPVCQDATIFLDGSQSTDVENDPLQFFWIEGTNTFATGVMATNHFAPGSHEIVLKVSDGSAVSSNSVVFEVLAPDDAVDVIAAFVEGSGLPRQRIRPLLATLDAAAASFHRCSALPGMLQLAAFQHQVDATVVPLDPDLAERLRSAAQEIIDAVNGHRTHPGKGNVLTDSEARKGNFKFIFSGPGSHAYFIDASTDLINWTVVGLAKDSGGGNFDYEDVRSAQYPGRFYRIRQW